MGNQKSRFPDSGKNFTRGGVVTISLDDSPARVALIEPKINDRIRAYDPDTGMLRQGTVYEVHPATRYVHVCFDLKWTHDWLAPHTFTVIEK